MCLQYFEETNALGTKKILLTIKFAHSHTFLLHQIDLQSIYLFLTEKLRSKLNQLHYI